jgi:hypoxanthine phosphoribosyltransferase
MQLDYNSAQEILHKSTILYNRDEIKEEIQKIAKLIEAEIKDDIPVFLSVMNGGMFFAAELLKNINSPLISDYIHASRYGGETFGMSHITWYRQPKPEDIRGKNIYIIDDILDEGYTLVEITRYLKSIGALSCKIVVLINKNIGKAKPIEADLIGLNSPNKFLFGYGMDIFGLYRQLPDIYVYNK